MATMRDELNLSECLYFFHNTDFPGGLFVFISQTINVLSEQLPVFHRLRRL